MRRTPSQAGFEDASVLVTGSSGFVGSHLCRTLSLESDSTNGLVGVDNRAAPSGASWTTIAADLSRVESVRGLNRFRPQAVVHLAAMVESIIPFEALGALVIQNISTTSNLLQGLSPRRFLYASSAAVYGEGQGALKTADWPSVNPGTVYGMSKAFGELASRDWALASGGSAISFRFGNVIGAACRGIVPFLVNHAFRYPDGSVPAQCRGNGEIVRDYVPVSFVVRALCAGLEMECQPGSNLSLNVGTSRPTTNGDVGRAAQNALSRHGLSLQINWNNPLSAGESGQILLEMGESLSRLSLELPDPEETTQAIVDAVDYLVAQKRLEGKKLLTTT